MEEVSDQLLRLDLHKMRFERMSPLPFKQYDLRTANDSRFIYSVGGIKSFFGSPGPPQSARYDTLKDKWSLLPTLGFEGVYDTKY